MQLHGAGVHRYAEVIIVAVKLCGMSGAPCEAVHGLKLEVGPEEEVVDSYRGDIEHPLAVETVAVHQVVAEGCLEFRGDEVAPLHVAAEVIVGVADFLAFRKTYVHEVGFGADVETVFYPREFGTGAEVVGAFVFAFYVHRGREAEEHPVKTELTRTSLCGGHHPFGHECETCGVEEGGYVPVVGKCLSGHVDRGSGAVEYPHFIPPFLPKQAMQFYTKVKPGGHRGGYGI